MICTECGRHVRPVVAVDIDGTLGVYHEDFRQFCERYWDRELPLGYDGSMEFSEWLGLKKEHYREAKLAYRQGGGKRMMPIFHDAKALIRTLKEQDCEVWLTTTRPYLRLDSTDPDTRFWLNKSGFEYDYLLYDEDKYHKLWERVDHDRILMIIDDLDTQIAEAARLFGSRVPVMVARATNVGAEVPPDVERLGMHEICREIIVRANHWRRSNDR